MKKRLIITFVVALLAFTVFSSVAMAADIGTYTRELWAAESYRYTTPRDKAVAGQSARHKNTEVFRSEGTPIASSISGRVMVHNSSNAATPYVSVSSGGSESMSYYSGYGDATSNYNLKLYNPHTYPIQASGSWSPDFF